MASVYPLSPFSSSSSSSSSSLFTSAPPPLPPPPFSSLPPPPPPLPLLPSLPSPSPFFPLPLPLFHFPLLPLPLLLFQLYWKHIFLFFLAGLRAVAHLWQEFVLEMRYRWENDIFIPRYCGKKSFSSLRSHLQPLSFFCTRGNNPTRIIKPSSGLVLQTRYIICRFSQG